MWTLFDMLSRIRNAILNKSSKVYIPQTRMTISIANVLFEEGYISSIIKGFVFDSKKYFCIRLKYTSYNNYSYITYLSRTSTSGLRFYSRWKKLPKILGGMGITIFML